MEKLSTWKQIKIDDHSKSEGICTDLMGIEELTDYSIIKGTRKKNPKSSESPVKEIENNCETYVLNKKKAQVKKAILKNEDSSDNQNTDDQKFQQGLKSIQKRESLDPISHETLPAKKRKKEKKQCSNADIDKHPIECQNDSNTTNAELENLVILATATAAKRGIKKKIKKCDNENIRKKKQKKVKNSYTTIDDTLVTRDEVVDTSMWDGLFVPPLVLDALADLGFNAPTPIQASTLPSAIRDRMDIIGAAETGSGKTLAFGIPIVEKILKKNTAESACLSENMPDTDNGVEKSDFCEEEQLVDGIGCVNVIKDIPFPWETTHNPHGPDSLILTPTRELAIQVKNHLVKICKYTDIKVSVIVGGLAMEKQARILKKNPQIIVATPGRLWELIKEGNPHACGIKNISSFVIDEADRMVEKGHFTQLLNILEYINDSELKKHRQTFVFSATLTLTHEAPRRSQLKKRRKVKLSSEEKLNSIVELVGMKSNPKVVDITREVGTVETLTEARINCDLDQKDFYLYYFLKEHPGRTLVFCNSIDCVRRLTALFTILDCSPLPLHADMHQKQRLKNLERFTGNPNGLLLASDVAARGLDIPEIEHIIHYQVPHTAETYIHRSGRTARAMKEGLSVMFIAPQEVTSYRKMCRTLNRDAELPHFPVEETNLSRVKEVVYIAREVDKIEHHKRKVKSRNNWVRQTAEEMDIDISDEDELFAVDEDQEQQAVTKRTLKILRKKLNRFLKCK